MFGLPEAEAAALTAIVRVIDLMAVAVFAITGALVAARRELDPTSFVFVGTITGVGGGSLRDLMLGVRPVFWVEEPVYLWITVSVSLAMFWGARLLASRLKALLWMDAIGLALFAVAGAQKAVSLGASSVVAVLMGVMSAAFGGLMRDILCGEKTLLFNTDIYATAAIAGAVAYLLLRELGVPPEFQALGGFLVGFGLRGAALQFGWALPHYKRPDRPREEV